VKQVLVRHTSEYHESMTKELLLRSTTTRMSTSTSLLLLCLTASPDLYNEQIY